MQKNVEQLFHHLKRSGQWPDAHPKLEKKPVRNRHFRLPKALEALPRRVKQEDDLGTSNTAQKSKSRKQKRCEGEGIRHQS
jgi:hypothetical protein